ncbi:MAG: C39 family peptidase [Patescibacteria group bacterium]
MNIFYKSNTADYRKFIPLIFLSVGSFFVLLLSQKHLKAGELAGNRSPVLVKAVSTTVELPSEHIIPQKTHVFQTYNNCGPASLSMLLSYVNISVSQHELGSILRPYQNTQGNNDDKSVTLDELAREAEKYDLVAYHRPNGTVNLLKRLVAENIPVMVRTWTKQGEDIGHYRIVRGYDDISKEFVQDDSLQGSNIRYDYKEFEELWKAFNYEFFIIAEPAQKETIQKILPDKGNPTHAWKKAIQDTESRLKADPDNVYARFNLSVAYYYGGNYEKAVREFEKVERHLPSRMLWYQIEPIQAYYKLKNYTRVLEMTDKIISNQNRAFSELYILRGKTYFDLNDKTNAKEEFSKAIYFNRNLPEAQEALSLFSD